MSKNREDICFRGTNVKGEIRSKQFQQTGRLGEDVPPLAVVEFLDRRITHSFENSARTRSKSVPPTLSRPTISSIGQVKPASSWHRIKKHREQRTEHPVHQ